MQTSGSSFHSSGMSSGGMSSGGMSSGGSMYAHGSSVGGGGGGFSGYSSGGGSMSSVGIGGGGRSGLGFLGSGIGGGIGTAGSAGFSRSLGVSASGGSGGMYGVAGGLGGGIPSAFSMGGGMPSLGMGPGTVGGGPFMGPSGAMFLGPSGGMYTVPSGGMYMGPGGGSGPAGLPSSPAFSIGRAITQGGFHSTVNNLMKTVPPMITRLTEKGILNNLNTRLVGYVEKVRQLTIENAMLEAQLKAMTGSSPVMPDPSITVDNYETTVTEMLHNINTFTLERVNLEIEVDNLRVAAEEIKSKYEFEAGVKFQMETDISNMKRDLDAAQEMKGDLTSKYTILQEDFAYHKTAHKEEMVKLSAKFGKFASTHSSMIEVDSGKSINLMEALTTLRSEYEAAAQRNREEADAYCTSKIEQIQQQTTETSEQITAITTQVTTLQTEIEDLSVEYQKLVNVNQMMQATLQDYQMHSTTSVTEVQNLIVSLEQEIETSHIALQNQLVNYQELLDVKTALDTEIQTYRNLLEGEEAMLLNVGSDKSVSAGSVIHGSRGSTTIISGGGGMASRPASVASPSLFTGGGGATAISGGGGGVVVAGGGGESATVITGGGGGVAASGGAAVISAGEITSSSSSSTMSSMSSSQQQQVITGVTVMEGGSALVSGGTVGGGGGMMMAGGDAGGLAQSVMTVGGGGGMMTAGGEAGEAPSMVSMGGVGGILGGRTMIIDE